MNLLEKFDLRKTIINSIITMIVGLIFCIIPEYIADFFILIIGAGIILVGLIYFSAPIIVDKTYKPTILSVFYLIVSILAGILLIIFSKTIVNISIIILGCILIISGFAQIFNIIRNANLGIKAPLFFFLFPITLIVLGALVCFNPFKTQTILFILFGTGMIMYSIFDIISIISIRRSIKSMNKDIKDVDFEEVK